ncbi:MAG: DUF882 domain-containing protein [Alphaproteobacteria bacterium]|nr:DUF882 domain-containing protein [Alphaproteobacteria bacterium]
MVWPLRGLGESQLSPSALLNRRSLIGAAASIAAVSVVRPAPAVAFAPRAVSLYNIHTGESLRTVYWADGHYIRDAVKDINWILRDHHSDEVRPMNAGVLDVLGMLRDRLETHDPFLVICGYRSATTNHMMYLRGDGVASNSFHIKGMAIDLRSERRDLTQVRNAALSLQCGGVGYYPRSDFVHVDCGPVRRW